MNKIAERDKLRDEATKIQDKSMLFESNLYRNLPANL